MNLPKPLVMFLAFCGGAAIFATPLLLGAIAIGAAGRADTDTGGGDQVPGSPSAVAEPSEEPISEEIIGELEFHAFDLGFEPASIEVDAPGRYSVSFANDGAILHDITFADGTVLEAEAGQTATGEVVVPRAGLGYICSIPGHADGGMQGAITVAGTSPDEVPHSGSGHVPGANAEIEPDPEAPEYVLRDATAPDLAEGETHDIELVITEREMTIAPGIVQIVWTFGDQVPGPVLRVKVGDIVRVTLVNPETNKLPHSIDFHASLVAWNDEMRSINPGEELVYEFEAKYAGVFMYHCGTTPALHHIAQGMYGMIIVEPEGGLDPIENEFALVQNEWYVVEQAGFISLEEASNPAPAPDAVVWNGIANQYADHPIEVPVGEEVRVFVLNAGPSVDSSFHVVGTIFHEVIKEGVHLVEGNEGNWGAQAVDLSPAQGAIVEMRFEEDGMYPIVTHAFNLVGRGALGLFQAGDGGPAVEGGH
ncbi:MAG TPA: multicopper oxidase domain-containing protein [Candidatus Limnocylindria bacterium]|nr:multicopper oxidase domain-containing protein [Candidatus Limnocylindria bacterium]